MKKQYVTVIGSLNYDFFLRVNRTPKMGETMHANQLQFSCGGKGANQAYQMGKLGLDTYMIGCVGNDVYGEESIQSLKSVGVNTSLIKKVNTNTGMGFVTVQNNGEVSAIIDKGANEFVDIDMINKSYDLIFNSSYIVLQMEIPLKTIFYIIEEASKQDTQVILNPAPSLPMSDDVLSKIDYLIVNEVEASYYLGEEVSHNNITLLARKLRDKVKHGLVLTYGSKGSYYIDKKNTFVPIVEAKAVDATGAGDSYIGSFVYGLSQGYSPLESCKFGAYSSAKAVESFGRESMPNHIN